MNMQMNPVLAGGGIRESQRVRRITEGWAGENLYCPFCGEPRLEHFENNRRVADFYCPACGQQFELKSSRKPMHRRVADGAYRAMVQRLQEETSPSFFFLQYDFPAWRVRNITFVPRYFMTTRVVSPRNPLSATAQRARWQGCTIHMEQIPSEGKLSIVRDGEAVSSASVLGLVARFRYVGERAAEPRGWALDMLSCLARIPRDEFMSADVYAFSTELAQRHPDNHNVQARIRRELQILRDHGVIAFRGRGKYVKIRHHS